MNIELSSGRVLEVLVTLVYGVVIGTWIPAPSADDVVTLPAVRAAAPAPRLLDTVSPAEINAQLVWPGTEAEQQPSFASVGRAVVLGTQAGIMTGMDTLPAAPTVAVALPAGAVPPDSRASVIRIGGGGSASSVARASASSDRCAAVISDGSDPDPFGCRSAARQRREALCPKPGGAGHQGTVICIRSPE